MLTTYPCQDPDASRAYPGNTGLMIDLSMNIMYKSLFHYFEFYIMRNDRKLQ